MDGLRWPQGAVKCLLMVLVFTSFSAHGNRNRKDLCGLSMHASDVPDVSNFSIISATWTIPEVLPRNLGSEVDAPWLSHGVALCCGDDCSTRLSAGMWATSSPFEGGGNDPYTATPMYQLSPNFGPMLLPGQHKFRTYRTEFSCLSKSITDHLTCVSGMNSSDTLRTSLEIVSPSTARM